MAQRLEPLEGETWRRKSKSSRCSSQKGLAAGAAAMGQGCSTPRTPSLAKLLGEPDEKSFGAADVTQPIRVLVLKHFADELRAALA
jgi:hypothetical protein